MALSAFGGSARRFRRWVHPSGGGGGSICPAGQLDPRSICPRIFGPGVQAPRGSNHPPGSLIMWGRKREPGISCVAYAPNVYANISQNMSYVLHIMMILTSHAILDVTYDTRVPGNLVPCSARDELPLTIRASTHDTRVPGNVALCSARGDLSKSDFFFAVAAKLLVCRLCWENVPGLYTKKSVERKWPSRISALLDIPVDCGDQLPPHVCFKCLTRVVSLEKSIFKPSYL